MAYNQSFQIGNRKIPGSTYFIADIGANHDGDLGRAKKLIRLAKDSWADCAKFQHFKARSIVSDVGFRDLKMAHQAQWPKSVYETYEDYSLNRDWNEELAQTCRDVGIDFMTTPYDLMAVEAIDHLVKAYKIGSGDITFPQLMRYIANKGKPVFLATGASTMGEVMDAVGVVLQLNPRLCLMQCNTNYSGDEGNFAYVNLMVLRTFATCWPGLPLGLSDHTPGYAAPLGAVALGARVIEKHFTDDPSRRGPDHRFALAPDQWKAMVQATRQLELALGDELKGVAANEMESRIVQRRAIRLKHDMPAGSVLAQNDWEALRPCPPGAYTPAQIETALGRFLRHDMKAGQEIYPQDLD